MSLRNFLKEIVGYDDGYINETVRTLFLNNSPVDDIDAAFIKDGDSIALGSAMPGLVGIVMGRDNPFKSFRSDISVLDKRSEDHETRIMVGLKIFSVLARDTGQDVMERGIWVDAPQLAAYLENRLDLILDADGGPATSFVAGLRERTDKVRIKVIFE